MSDKIASDCCGACKFYRSTEAADSSGRLPCKRFPATEFKAAEDLCGEFKLDKSRNADTAPKAPAVSL